jgi:hypothetical protein
MGSSWVSRPEIAVRDDSLDVSSFKSTYVNSDVAQLWPAKLVVHVVLAEVVLGQVGDVRRLDVRNV